MKNTGLFLIAVAVFSLAAALAFQAQTGRYEIAAVAGLSGVYRVDTRTGDLSICSPVYQQGCITLNEAYLNIEKHRKNVKDTAQGAMGAIDQFTVDRAKELRGLIKQLGAGQEEGQEAVPAE